MWLESEGNSRWYYWRMIPLKLLINEKEFGDQKVLESIIKIFWRKHNFNLKYGEKTIKSYFWLFLWSHSHSLSLLWAWKIWRLQVICPQVYNLFWLLYQPCVVSLNQCYSSSSLLEVCKIWHVWAADQVQKPHHHLNKNMKLT